MHSYLRNLTSELASYLQFISFSIFTWIFLWHQFEFSTWLREPSNHISMSLCLHVKLSLPLNWILTFLDNITSKWLHGSQINMAPLSLSCNNALERPVTNLLKLNIIISWFWILSFMVLEKWFMHINQRCWKKNYK